MRRGRVLIVIFGLLLVMAGCVWVSKGGTSQEQLARDRYACERDAAALNTSFRHCMEALGYSTSYLPWRASDEAERRSVANMKPSITPTGTPWERLTERRRPLTQALLRRVEQGGCPRLVPCLAEYEGQVRRIAQEEGYTVVSADELLFRAIRQIGQAADEGTITQDQAVNRLLALDAEIEARSKPPTVRK